MEAWFGAEWLVVVWVLRCELSVDSLGYPFGFVGAERCVPIVHCEYGWLLWAELHFWW